MPSPSLKNVASAIGAISVLKKGMGSLIGERGTAWEKGAGERRLVKEEAAILGTTEGRREGKDMIDGKWIQNTWNQFSQCLLTLIYICSSNHISFIAMGIFVKEKNIAFI